MPVFLECNCSGCGKKFKLTDDYMICLKDDELVEMEVAPLLHYEIKGHISKTYCNNCEKFVKIYSPHYIYDKDKDKSIEEIKEYMKHKRPRNTIKIFMEEYSDKIICPECNDEVKLGFYGMHKCPKCGSEKFDVMGIYVNY